MNAVSDYNACVFNHSEILVNIKIVDGLNKEISSAVVQRFKKHNRLSIIDAGCNINIRFENDVSLENSKWGRFQAHRQVMGFVLVAHASTALDVALIHENFHKLKEQFGALQSRCIIFGIDTGILKQHSPDVLKFSSLGSWKSYDYDIKEFLTAIFYELEAKRLKLELEKGIKPPLIKAPFESTDKNIDASDSSERRNFRKRCTGRHLKYLGDVNLLAGRISNALLSYHSAIDTLTSINDCEWVGSALEGLCAISSIINFPHTDLPQRMSFNNKQNSKQTLDPRNLMNKQSPNAASLDDIKKLCIPNIEQIVDRYKEAVINYSRNKSLGIVEMEACIKATRVLITAGKKLAASEFLQNAVYITLNLSDEERVIRYSILANLYADIGFQRKSSFFKRVAAMQCVAPHLEHQNWNKCNKLLMDSLPGYNINLSKSKVTGSCHVGWPNIQTRVFHELIFSSKKMGKNLLANRHTLQFLLCMHSVLSDSEEQDICNSLESNSKKIMEFQESTSKNSNGIYPIATPYSLPVLKTLNIAPLTGIDHPVLVGNITGTRTPATQDVFLYTPTKYDVTTSQTHFKWTVNTACTICLVLYNPLTSHTLSVSGLTLINSEYTKGFECLPVTTEIPPSSNISVNIKLLPTSPGKLNISGFKYTSFGIQFECDFEGIEDVSLKNIEIIVVPELPVLCLDSKDSAYVKPNVCLVESCYGEIRHGFISLINTSETAVDFVRVHSKMVGNNLPENEPVLTWKEVDSDGLKEKLIKLPFKLNMADSQWNDEKIEFDITVQYSGGNAYTQNWCRNLNFKLKVNLLNCLNISKALVKNHELDASVCTFKLSVINNLSNTVYICFKSLKGRKYIEEETPLKEFATSNIDIERYKLWDNNCKDLNEDNLKNNLLDYLKNLIKLAWRFIGDDGVVRTGEIDLRRQGNLLSDCIYDIIYCPIAMTLNSKHTDDKNSFKCTICQPIHFAFELRNISKVPISFTVKLNIIQTQHNGYKISNMHNVVIFNGAESKNFTDLPPDNSVNFNSSLTFLYQGYYQCHLLYDIAMSNEETSIVTLQSNIYKVSVLP